MLLFLKRYAPGFCLCLVLILCSGTIAHSQTDESIQGRVIDSLTGKPIAGAVIRIESGDEITITNDSGAFRLDGLAPGSLEVTAESLGYRKETRTCRLEPGDQITLLFRMQEEELVMSDVVLQAEQITGRNSVSEIRLDASALRSAQGLLEDPVRTLTLLPGVNGGGDLFAPSEIFVRGGAPEENLFLLDKTKLYWPWYFGGMKSVYNTDVVDRVELLTGGFPASFGNHMSSVLNVITRPGSFREWSGGLSIGFFNAAADIEGPIISDKLSIIAAVRRTYLDLFLDESAAFPLPSFGDITYKIAFRPASSHRISLSGLSSEESIAFLAAEPEPGLPDRINASGRTHTQSGEWLAIIGEEIVSKLALTHSSSSSRFAIGQTIDAKTEGETWGLRYDVDWNIEDRRAVKFGTEGTQNTFNLAGTFPLDPGETDPNDTTITLRPYDLSSESRLAGAYLLYDGDLTGNLGMNAGLRLDHHDMADLTDISPRLALRYSPGKKIELRGAFGEYHQFPQEEALSYNSDLQSELSRHYIAGVHYRFSPAVAGWIEGYVKDYRNLTTYDSLLNYRSNGTGVSKGIELFLRKEQGALQGWISYAFSRATRQAPLQDQVYRFEYDQPHVFNCGLLWRADSSKAWYIPSQISGQFRFASGRPYTPVVSGVQTPEGWRPVKGEINSEENPYYLNLNLRLEWGYDLGAGIEGTSFLEVWNLTNRKNILGRTYRYGSEFDHNVLEQPYYTTPLLVGGGFRVRF